MDTITIAYAAGLIDGEGTITLVRKAGTSKGKPSSPYRSPTLSMSSTSPELVQFMKDNFKGCISSHKTYQAHHKPSWIWKVSNLDAIEAIKHIAPYLREPEKLRRANLILSTYPKVTIRNGKYSEEQRAAKLAFEHEFFHPSTASLPCETH